MVKNSTVIRSQRNTPANSDQHSAKYIVLLQNAWSPFYAGDTWPRTLWLAALARSRSGQRLSIIRKITEPLGIRLWFDNTTPIVGAEPNSVVPPDHDHIKKIIKTVKPKGVICCGHQALKAIDGIYKGPVMALPHPANRVLKNVVYEKAGQILAGGLKKSVSIGWDRDKNKVVVYERH